MVMFNHTVGRLFILTPALCEACGTWQGLLRVYPLECSAVPSTPSVALRVAGSRRSSGALFSSTSGETQPCYIFVPKSQNGSLSWLPSHLFQTGEEEKLICKEKERVLHGRAEASFGDGPCPERRVCWAPWHQASRALDDKRLPLVSDMISDHPFSLCLNFFN